MPAMHNEFGEHCSADLPPMACSRFPKSVLNGAPALPVPVLVERVDLIDQVV